MKIRELQIIGSYLITNDVYPDSRGFFFEWFERSALAENEIYFSVAQANFSTSAKSVIRGIHYSLAEKGQSKIILCSGGVINDVIIDLRIDSPTFLAIQKVSLTAESGRVLYIPSGVGHGFSVMSESASLTYLLTSEYSPDFEHTIHPLDNRLAIDWGLPEEESPQMSHRDSSAPSFDEAFLGNMLPKYIARK